MRFYKPDALMLIALLATLPLSTAQGQKGHDAHHPDEPQSTRSAPPSGHDGSQQGGMTGHEGMAHKGMDHDKMMQMHEQHMGSQHMDHSQMGHVQDHEKSSSHDN